LEDIIANEVMFVPSLVGPAAVEVKKFNDACFVVRRHRWAEARQRLTLTPAYDSARHDSQSSPTGDRPYHLADDWDDVEAPQGWDQELEELRTDNSAYSSRNQVSGRT
jgi:hypothetical protein